MNATVFSFFVDSFDSMTKATGAWPAVGGAAFYFFIALWCFSLLVSLLVHACNDDVTTGTTWSVC